MFKFLKDGWKDAKKRVEDEDNARVAASAAKTNAADGGLNMPGVAQEFATRMSAQGTLDFTPASIAIVDRLLAGVRKELAGMPVAERKTKENWACLNVGAYVGEVLRRDEGGIWTTGDDGLPLLNLGSHLAPTVTAVLGLITDGRIEMPGGPVETLAEYCQAVSNASRTWLEAALRGSHATMESLQREMSDDGELAKWLSNQAQVAVKTARTKWNTSLDFTPRSLDAVEHVLAQLHDLLKSATPADQLTDKQIESTSLIWGVYVGEVLRRDLGGKWAISRPDGVLQLEINQARMFPVRRVQKRLVDGPDDAIPFYFNAMRATLASG